mgnify:CR=1 FL=1
MGDRQKKEKPGCVYDHKKDEKGCRRGIFGFHIKPEGDQAGEGGDRCSQSADVRPQKQRLPVIGKVG